MEDNSPDAMFCKMDVDSKGSTKKSLGVVDESQVDSNILPFIEDRSRIVAAIDFEESLLPVDFLKKQSHGGFFSVSLKLRFGCLIVLS